MCCHSLLSWSYFGRWQTSWVTESLNSAHPNLQQNGKTVGCLVQLHVCTSTDQEGGWNINIIWPGRQNDRCFTLQLRVFLLWTSEQFRTLQGRLPASASDPSWVWLNLTDPVMPSSGGWCSDEPGQRAAKHTRTPAAPPATLTGWDCDTGGTRSRDRLATNFSLQWENKFRT